MRVRVTECGLKYQNLPSVLFDGLLVSQCLKNISLTHKQKKQT